MNALVRHLVLRFMGCGRMRNAIRMVLIRPPSPPGCVPELRLLFTPSRIGVQGRLPAVCHAVLIGSVADGEEKRGVLSCERSHHEPTNLPKTSAPWVHPPTVADLRTRPTKQAGNA